ncbi:MAG: hypothetical protein ACW99L_19590, partial [Promethearchaeota archaeon]
ESFEKLKFAAVSYYHDVKDDMIDLEDQRIVITTEKMRKTISNDEFKESIAKIENDKQKIGEKLAFLKVKIIDYSLE